MSKDDEDATYLPAYKSRNAKRPSVDYENCGMKKSRTVGDLTALMIGCHDDNRSGNCKADDGFKVIVGECFDSFNYFLQAPVADVNMDLIQQFVFMNMSSPMNKSSSLSYAMKDLELEIPQAVRIDDDEDEPPSI